MTGTILVDGPRETDELKINSCEPIMPGMTCREIRSEIKAIKMIEDFIQGTYRQESPQQTEISEANSNRGYSTSWNDTDPQYQKEIFKFDYNEMIDPDLEKFADLLSRPEFSKYSISMNGKSLHFEQGTTETHRKTEILKTIKFIQRIQKIRNFIQSERLFPYFYIEMHPHKNSRKWTEAENIYVTLN